MQHSGPGQIMSHESLEPLPRPPAALTAPPQRASPVPRDPLPERFESWQVARNCVIAEVSTDNLPQPVPSFRNRLVYAPAQFHSDTAEFGRHALPHRLAVYRELAPFMDRAANMCESQYADDFVLGFQHRKEAERFLEQLRKRLADYGLELHSDKTRLIQFGRLAAADRSREGSGKPETFDFLALRLLSTKGATGISWFPCIEFPCVPEVSDSVAPSGFSRFRSRPGCLPLGLTASALHFKRFRNSILSPHVPLSTLRDLPYDVSRMTRGQDGSLLL